MMRLNIKKQSKHLKLIPRVNTSLMFDPKCSICKEYLPVTAVPHKYYATRSLEPVCDYCHVHNPGLATIPILYFTSLNFHNPRKLVYALMNGNYQYYWKHEALILTVIGGTATLHDLLNETKVVLFIGRFKIYNLLKNASPPLDSSLSDIYSWIKEVNEHANDNLFDP